MSHEIDMSNGRANMASTQKEWHGLQNILAEGAPLEEWAVAAGMNHKILRATVRYATSHSADAQNPANYRKMDDKVVLFRGDSGNAMGVVSDSYKVVQPREVLEFFRDLVASQGFKMATAGCLFDGRKYWALAETGDATFIKDARDIFKSYLLLSSSCDGSSATEARFTDIRVVCNNTMSMALRDKANAKVSHKSVFSPEAVRADLGILAAEAFSDRIQSLRALADKPLTFDDLVKLTCELVAPGSTATEEGIKKAGEIRAAKMIGDMALHNTIIGGEYAGTKGTAYGWLQAVTEYVDHKVRARSSDNRQSSAWFGPGAALKTRALELATTL